MIPSTIKCCLVESLLLDRFPLVTDSIWQKAFSSTSEQLLPSQLQLYAKQWSVLRFRISIWWQWFLFWCWCEPNHCRPQTQPLGFFCNIQYITLHAHSFREDQSSFSVGSTYFESSSDRYSVSVTRLTFGQRSYAFCTLSLFSQQSLPLPWLLYQKNSTIVSVVWGQESVSLHTRLLLSIHFIHSCSGLSNTSNLHICLVVIFFFRWV